VIPFGLVGVPMQAMFHNAAFLAAGVPVFDIKKKFGATDLLVSDGAKGVALAESLGRKDIAMMRAHGSVTCGPTLQTAVFRAVYTEVNARIQHWALALAGGKPMAVLDAEEGRLADVINQTAGMRAWDLWRTQTRAQVGW
jgi:HCOMODA/2-hydroxy-3-carboxy-muconic semialdehyde decarboxylase